MKMRTFTLLALLALVSLPSFAQTPIADGFYRLSSGRATGRIMTVNSDGKLATRAKTAGELSLVWLITKTGQGNDGALYTFRSALTGQYIQEQKTMSTNFYPCRPASDTGRDDHKAEKQ